MPLNKKLIAAMHQLTITMFDEPNQAPNYNEEEGWKAAMIKKAVVVGNGTKEGKPTVDIQFEDEDGNKYVGMITGELIKGLAKAVEGVHARTQEKKS